MVPAAILSVLVRVTDYGLPVSGVSSGGVGIAGGRQDRSHAVHGAFSTSDSTNALSD